MGAVSPLERIVIRGGAGGQPEVVRKFTGRVLTDPDQPSPSSPVAPERECDAECNHQKCNPGNRNDVGLGEVVLKQLLLAECEERHQSPARCAESNRVVLGLMKNGTKERTGW